MNRLVVNGCSYMDAYAQGGGHLDLAKSLGIPVVESLAIGGSANSRIIRTVLKDSYGTNTPTFYVLGLTFVSRGELPILKLPPGETDDDSFEGRWSNPQNQYFKSKWEHFWTEKDTALYVDIRHKAEVYSLVDRTEDLMYQLLSMISDLESRGHRALIYQQADESLLLTPPPENKSVLERTKLQLLNSKHNFVHGLRWPSVIWQHEQGVPEMRSDTWVGPYGETPEHLRHRMPGHHQKLNEYLINYINEFKILA